MPTLHWIGKNKIINHHLEVPYKVLNHEYGFSDKEKTRSPISDGNMIINGDNLEALKSLLPKYEGKVNCIYIDPPYNTGNEGWVYNDNVSSPQIQKWFQKVVGKESEDLTRHDKWLCMMYPRLKLLHKLLAHDGAIFISIDDNEQANLKLMMDEIFGTGNFISHIVWRRRKSQANLSKNISPIHDFVVTYAKSQRTILNNLIQQLDIKNFKNEDNDPRGPYTTMPSTNKGGAKYTITTPTGLKITDEWRFKEETFFRLLNENRLVFPRGGDGKPRYKMFYHEKMKDGAIANTWWDDESSNQEASVEISSIFENKVFDTPKPVKFLDKILRLATNKNAIILDSFAGSGTTAHAVLNLNKQDGGNRKFILIEMEDYAETITAERVKRVINGYADKAPTGGSFDYYSLGEPLFNEDNNLNEDVGEEKIREYVWFTETRVSYTQSETAPYLGTHNDTSYYFIYDKDVLTTLDYEALAGFIKHKAERYIIYADNCLLPEIFMREKNIEFKKIPRDITRF